MVHTRHFPIVSRPKPGGGVYLRGPNTAELLCAIIVAVSAIVQGKYNATNFSVSGGGGGGGGGGNGGKGGSKGYSPW